ncbi:MAG TPA: hypothetical protein VMI33_23670 [Streptosporangiaceae bacterium]|nr:hypothetical protein [Streptosporangiaceae bacterium]
MPGHRGQRPAHGGLALVAELVGAYREGLTAAALAWLAPPG